MTSTVTFSFRAYGACEYIIWVNTIEEVQNILNQIYPEHFTTPLTLIGQINNVYPATADFSYTTNDDKNETRKFLNCLNSTLMMLCSVIDVKIN